jgi:N-hydroxyarylamine O-acetyltransferase
MEIEAYLRRIGYSGPRTPTAETLRHLHRAHMFAVPFENFDIPLGKPIILSLPAFYAKIVERRRGGFCYELNGLFGWLLEQLGFRVVRLSAGVYGGGEPGPAFDHLTLLVETEDRLLADVGFGDSFVEPLPLDGSAAAAGSGTLYRLTGVGLDRVLERQKPGAGWEPQYAFTLQPHHLDEFGPRCHWTQTSPESGFTRKVSCSLATPDGRITLANRRLITTTGRMRTEQEVTSIDEYRALLKAHFGIDLGPQLEPLWHATALTPT